MNYSEMVERYSKEKDLVTELVEQLKAEVDFVISGDVDALEASLPAKQKILRAIADNRKEIELASQDPSSEEASRLRKLQQELIGLWKQATYLNDKSKELISGRLDEISMQLKPFLGNSQEAGYDRSGHAARSYGGLVKGGV